MIFGSESDQESKKCGIDRWKVKKSSRQKLYLCEGVWSRKSKNGSLGNLKIKSAQNLEKHPLDLQKVSVWHWSWEVDAQKIKKHLDLQKSSILVSKKFSQISLKITRLKRAPNPHYNHSTLLFISKITNLTLFDHFTKTAQNSFFYTDTIANGLRNQKIIDLDLLN